MTLTFENEQDFDLGFDPEEVAAAVINGVLDQEACPYEAEVELILTDPENIRTMNREHRNIDRETDVLSFPMVDYPSPASFDFLETEEGDDCFNPDSGELMLGDIVISVARARAQAEEYGHSLRREFAFLVAHSMLHLLGYDHERGEDDTARMRRREKELQTKDATISEIHHRVKNNLQAVSALLRLQARKTKSEEVKKELKEAQRRVQTIAMVHEGLSQTADEIVDYDKVISNLLKMAVDLATMRDQHIDVDFVGKFGMMPAQDATPLSLVLTELITNSVGHGFEGRKEGHITISVGRGGNNLNVVVEDDGTGLADEEHDGMARSSGSGLGTQIINTFVTNDFGGTVHWEPRRGGGTRVVLDMKLRAAQDN